MNEFEQEIKWAISESVRTRGAIYFDGERTATVSLDEIVPKVAAAIEAVMDDAGDSIGSEWGCRAVVQFNKRAKAAALFALRRPRCSNDTLSKP